MKKAQGLILAPHFGYPAHLGGLRTGRFQKWATAAGYPLLVVRAGSRDEEKETDFGRVITIRDPFGFYRDPGCASGELDGDRRLPSDPRAPNRFRQILAYMLFIPDPMLQWGRRVLRSPSLRNLESPPRWILASSPPESSLVIAARLSRRWGSALLLDFRDGWLDESMIPLVKTSRIQRIRHRRLERKTLAAAGTIMLSSGVWQELLCSRYPEFARRMVVLSNSCPADFPSPVSGKKNPGPLHLLYAGKIHSSRPERSCAQIFEPLLKNLKPGGILSFRGNLSKVEILEIEAYARRMEKCGWKVEIHPPLPRRELFAEIVAADGLLLLSASRASIPAKLFDYLPSLRPILALAPGDSVVASLQEKIPQLYLAPPGREAEGIASFIRACRKGSRASIPDDMQEEYLRSVFLDVLEAENKTRSSPPENPGAE